MSYVWFSIEQFYLLNSIDCIVNVINYFLSFCRFLSELFFCQFSCIIFRNTAAKPTFFPSLLNTSVHSKMSCWSPAKVSVGSSVFFQHSQFLLLPMFQHSHIDSNQSNSLFIFIVLMVFFFIQNNQGLRICRVTFHFVQKPQSQHILFLSL